MAPDSPTGVLVTGCVFATFSVAALSVMLFALGCMVAPTVGAIYERVDTEPASEVPLHTEGIVVDQPDRETGSRSSPAKPSHPPGHLQLGQDPHQPDPRLHQHWNTNPKPFAWTATADDILAKVRLVQTNIKKLVDNNTK
ncbi:hypothetical protein [Kribbella pittospori]|uniref:hypothetical protein n=1 Tax=Kribbella pittospori TaxID=722689 RepID=UPI001EDCF4AF|nr:hypothetical protein [Kribbella pittospori]